MSLGFITEEIAAPNYPTYENGVYKVQIDHIERGSSFYTGAYVEIHRRFMDGPYENEVWVTKYHINHENEKRRYIARQTLSRLAKDIAQLPPGEELKEEDLLYKITQITVENKASKNGTVFSNIVKEVLVDDKGDLVSEKLPISNLVQPLQPPLPSDPIPLNDEVPF